MKYLLTCFVAAVSIIAGTAAAGPVVQIKGGMTTLTLNEEILGLLGTCDVGRIKPAGQSPDGSRWRFPVSGGVIDLETSAGELEHRGGILISCGAGPEEATSIQNLRAEYLEDKLVLTAVVVVGQEPLQRIPLFSPLSENLETSVSKGGVVRLSGVQLNLTAAAAEFLNILLGTTQFSDDTEIGQAVSRIKVLPSATRGNGNGNGNGKDKIKVKDSDDDDNEDEEELEEEEEVDS
jgi:hypothetical protein